MTGNTNYTTSSPTLTVFNTAVTAYKTALGNVENGSTTATSAKGAARVTLENLMQSLGLYVQLNCGNDLTKAQCSGYDLHAEPTAAVIPAVPTGIKGDTGDNTGQIIASCNAQPEADFFMCRYSLNVTTPVWVVMPPQKSRKFLISGLTHRHDILISLSAANAAGISDWSNAVMVLVY